MDKSSFRKALISSSRFLYHWILFYYYFFFLFRVQLVWRAWKPNKCLEAVNCGGVKFAHTHLPVNWRHVDVVARRQKQNLVLNYHKWCFHLNTDFIVVVGSFQLFAILYPIFIDFNPIHRAKCKEFMWRASKMFQFLARGPWMKVNLIGTCNLIFWCSFSTCNMINLQRAIVSNELLHLDCFFSLADCFLFFE